MAELNWQSIETQNEGPVFDGLLVRAVECYLEDNSVGLSDELGVNGHMPDIVEILDGDSEQALLILAQIRDSAEASIEADKEENIPTIPGTVNGESVMIPINRLGVGLLPPGIEPIIEELTNVYNYAGRTKTTFESSGFTDFSRDDAPYQEKPEKVDPYTKI